MHILQFFRDFLSAIDIEVVEAPLPKVRLASPDLFEQRARDLLLQHLNRSRRITPSRLADENVHMLRNHDVAYQAELVASADSSENPDETVAGFRRAEQGRRRRQLKVMKWRSPWP